MNVLKKVAVSLSGYVLSHKSVVPSDRKLDTEMSMFSKLEKGFIKTVVPAPSCPENWLKVLSKQEARIFPSYSTEELHQETEYGLVIALKSIQTGFVRSIEWVFKPYRFLMSITAFTGTWPLKSVFVHLLWSSYTATDLSPNKNSPSSHYANSPNCGY